MKTATGLIKDRARARVERLDREPDTGFFIPDFIDWMNRFRYMLTPTIPFQLESRPYLRDLYNLKKWPAKLTIKKSSQVGATEFIFSLACFRAAEHGDMVLYLFPNDTLMSAFSSARFGQAFEASPSFNSLLRKGSEVGGVTQVKTKRLKHGTLLLRGAKLDADGRNAGLLSIPADVLVVDEINAVPDPSAVIALGQKRLKASDRPMEIYTSTPTYDGVGISELYSDSDCHEWFVECPNGHEQTISIQNVVTSFDSAKRPITWHTDDFGDPFIACKHCGSRIGQYQIDNGRWEARRETRENVGYYIHGLLNRPNLRQIIKGLQSYNETVRRECWNQDLGEEFEIGGETGLSDQIINAAEDAYSIHTPPACDAVFCGVDVGTHYHITVTGRRDGVSILLWLGAYKQTSEVIRVIEKWDPIVTVIDSQPESRAVNGIKDHFDHGKVFLCSYKPLETKNPIKLKHSDGAIIADRTRTIDDHLEKWYSREFFIPADIDTISDYRSHMKAPRRIMAKTATGERAVWEEFGRADHWFHSSNYAHIAYLTTEFTLDMESGVAGIED